MKRSVVRIARRLAQGLGYELMRRDQPPFAQPDIVDPAFRAIARRCEPYTKTSSERLYALYQAVAFLVRHDIPGAIVECGVWRGGSMMAAALSLQQCGDLDRDLYLYDTYEGMAEPTAKDVSFDRRDATLRWRRRQRQGMNTWNYASLDEVRTNLLSTGYPEPRVRFIKGKVEDTLPDGAPEQIALLRLDTDFYESTRHELEHLWPRLVPRGVLIIDDYGHWSGARQATDEFFAALREPWLLHRVDYSARVAVKL